MTDSLLKRMVMTLALKEFILVLSEQLKSSAVIVSARERETGPLETLTERRNPSISFLWRIPNHVRYKKQSRRLRTARKPELMETQSNGLVDGTGR